jgi:hypothetical protein
VFYTPKGFYILAQGQRSATLGKKNSLASPLPPKAAGKERGGEILCPQGDYPGLVYAALSEQKNTPEHFHKI